MKHLGIWKNIISTSIAETKYYVLYIHNAMFIIYMTGKGYRINSVYSIVKGDGGIEESTIEFEDFWLFGDDMIFELTEDEIYRHILCEVI